MNWILILWFVVPQGVNSTKIDGFTRKGCESEALRIMAPKDLNILCVCVEKK